MHNFRPSILQFLGGRQLLLLATFQDAHETWFGRCRLEWLNRVLQFAAGGGDKRRGQTKCDSTQPVAFFSVLRVTDREMMGDVKTQMFRCVTLPKKLNTNLVKCDAT